MLDVPEPPGPVAPRWSPPRRRSDRRTRSGRPGGPYVIRRADGAYAPLRIVPLAPPPDPDEAAGAAAGPIGRVRPPVAAVTVIGTGVAWAALVLVGLRWPHAARTIGGTGAVDHALWRTLLADRILAVAGWLATASSLFVLGGALFRGLVAGPVERRASSAARAAPRRRGGPGEGRHADRPYGSGGVVPARDPTGTGVAARQAAMVQVAAVVGVLASAAAVVLRAVELSAGSVSIGLTRLGHVATTPFGIAAVTRAVGLVLLAWSATSPSPARGPAPPRTGALGGIAVLTAFAVVGHPQATPASSHALRAALVGAQVAHVLTTAVWFGGICLLAVELRARRRLGDPCGSAAVIGRFSTLAGVTMLGVAATGTVLAWSQIAPLGAAPGTAYGRALLAKLACVAVVVAIGAYNRQRLVPAVERHGDAERAWHGLRRTLLAEALVIGGGVLVATAAMTSGGF